MDAKFKTDVTHTHRLLSLQIASIEAVLISLVGLHHSSDDLNTAELSSFSENMIKAYPYIHAILTVEKITDNERGLFEEKMQSQGFFNVKLPKRKHLKQPNKHPFYLPVNFIEPMTPLSANILAFDLLSINTLSDVIHQSIANNEVSASVEVETKGQRIPLTLLFKPLYKGRYPPNDKQERLRLLSGLVVIELNLENFINEMHISPTLLKAYINDNKQHDYTLYNSLISKQSINLYGQTINLMLIRPFTLDMFNRWQLFLIWLVFMVTLFLSNSVLQKRKLSEEKIKRLAYFDSLTQLPNRASFKEQVTIAIQNAIQNKSFGAVMFLDLDEFKRINDTLGHEAGDELLIQVSKRLTGQMRQNDSVINVNSQVENNLVTRLGGDEFTVLLTKIDSNNSVALVAERIQKSIRLPYQLNNHEVFITSSIGIAIFPIDGENIDQILKHADTAMYHAKSLHKNNYQFYSKQMSTQAEERLNLEEKLRHALEKNEFYLLYQPQIDAKTDKIIAAEALIRWKQSELGMVLPDEFIPLAEETGLITDIGAWVIKEACRQNKAWQDKGLSPIRIAVNLSTVQFRQPNLVEMIKDTLIKASLKPQYLELEITESIMMDNVEETISIIKQFADLSINVSIDDFGTGYSSLSYLKKFPLTSLKIDKSFISDIPKDNDDMMITAAIISMAKSLHLKVVAEGVENKQQIDFLKHHDCDYLQGYYFAKPLSTDEFEKLI